MSEPDPFSVDSHSLSQVVAQDNGVPLYIRVAASLRTRIFQGEWEVGSRLPSFEEIGRAYGVAINTVRKAVESLCNEGLLVAARGRGTTVARTQPSAFNVAVQEEMRDPLKIPADMRIDIIKCEAGQSIPPILLQHYKPLASYTRILKSHSVRGTPYALLDVYVEQTAFDRFPANALKKTKILRLLQDQPSNQVSSSRQELTITHADQATANVLRCSPAAALVRIRRWKLSSAAEIIFASEILYRGDMFTWDVSGPEDNTRAIIPEARPI